MRKTHSRLPWPVIFGTVALAALWMSSAQLRPAVAQDNPTMTNVIPAGGAGIAQGKLQSIAADGKEITVVSSTGSPMTFVVGPNVQLPNLSQGDTVSINYERTVLFTAAAPGAATQLPTTQTVGQFAHTPGGIPAEGLQLSGTILKINPGHDFDVVNPNGGGVYSVQVTDPERVAMLSSLKVGDTISVTVSPLTITAIKRCGLFGC